MEVAVDVELEPIVVDRSASTSAALTFSFSRAFLLLFTFMPFSSFAVRVHAISTAFAFVFCAAAIRSEIADPDASCPHSVLSLATFSFDSRSAGAGFPACAGKSEIRSDHPFEPSIPSDSRSHKISIVFFWPCPRT